VEPNQPDSGARAELSVVVNPATIQVERGRTAELTCVVYGGDSSTSIYWIQEEPERVHSPFSIDFFESFVMMKHTLVFSDMLC
jgi:hypothetical protein